MCLYGKPAVTMRTATAFRWTMGHCLQTISYSVCCNNIFLLGGAYLRGFFVVSFALKYIEMRFYHFYLLRQLIQTFIKAFAGFKAA